MKSFVVKVISILITAVVVSAAVADVQEEEAKEFAKEIQGAFDTADKLDTGILKTGVETWLGECVSSFKSLTEPKRETHTYLNGVLTIESFRKLGKRTLKFGYGKHYERGFAEYSAAYVSDDGDLTIDAVTEWTSGEGTVNPFRSFHTLKLRRGTFNEAEAYLFVKTAKRFTTLDDKNPVSEYKTVCYLDEREDQN